MWLADLQEALFLVFAPVVSAWLVLVIAGGVLAAAFHVFMEFVSGFER